MDDAAHRRVRLDAPGGHARPTTIRRSAALLATRRARVHDLRQDVARFTCARSCGSTPEENLAHDRGDRRATCVANGRRVIYDAEHFFDGSREDAAFALETCARPRAAGAEAIVLCDTNGGSLPWEIEQRVGAVVARASARPARASTRTTTRAAASPTRSPRCGPARRTCRGRINGYGERCGNANLCSIVPTLELKMGCGASARARSPSSRTWRWQVAEIANLAPDAHAPYVGRSAFAHKGGVHVAAIRRHPRAYEHVDPGARRQPDARRRERALGSRQRAREGRGVRRRRSRRGATSAVLRDVKEREARGFAFEAAEASVALMMRRESAGYAAPFELVDYKVIVGQREREEAFSEATIKIRVARRDRAHGGRRAAARSARSTPRCARRWSARTRRSRRFASRTTRSASSTASRARPRSCAS